MVAVVVVAALVAVGVARLGVVVLDRQRAQAAADAAALAGVDAGPSGAARLAGVNGARLVSFRRTGAPGGGGHTVVVTVVVAVGEVRATARASNGP